MAGAREILELVIKGDAKGAIEAFRGTSDAADKAEGSVSRSGAMFEKLTGRFPVLGKAAEKFGVDAGNAGTVAAGAATAAATAVAAFAAKSVTAYQNVAGEILKFQRASGASAEEASKFVEVAGDYGMSADQAAGSIGKLAKAVSTSPAAFREYGIEVAKNADGTTDLVGTLVNAAGAFDRVQDPAKRAEMGTKLFGKSWQDLLPLLEKGSEGLRESFEGVSELKILNEEDLKQAEEFRLAMDDLKDAGEGLMIQVGRGLVPVISDLATELGKVTAQADKLTKPIGGLGTVTGGLVKSLREGSFALGGFKAAWQGASEKAKEAEEAENKAADAIRYAGSQADLYVKSLIERNAAGEESIRVAEETAEAEEDAADKQREAAKRVADAQKDRADATRDAYRAAEESVNPILRERAANRELAKAADDVKKATDEAAKAKFKDVEKNDVVVAGQDGLITKMSEVASAYATAQGASEGTKKHAELYVTKLKELRDQYGVQLGPAIAIYDELIRRIEATIRLQDEANRTAAGYNVGGGGDRGQPGRPVAFSYGGAAASITVPAMGQAVNLTVKIDAPIVTNQAAQWVADQLAVYIRTNGSSSLRNLLGVTA